MALGTDYRLENGNYQAYAWPGGYPLYYVCADNGVLCSDCVNEHKELDSSADPQWNIIAADINYEDSALYCDHCNERIESAYAEDTKLT